LYHDEPPGSKTIACLAGVVSDVILDLRPESPAYGRYETFALRGDIARNLFIPAGVAHAFLIPSEKSRVPIRTDPSGGPDAGFGVRRDSFGYDRPCGPRRGVSAVRARMTKRRRVSSGSSARRSSP